MFLINIFLGLSSAVALCIVLGVIERKVIPFKTLMLFFLAGVASLFLGLALSMFMEGIIPYFELEHGGPDLFRLLVGTVIGIAFFEEIVKWCFGVPMIMKTRHFAGIFGSMVCCGFIGIGFGVPENILYMLDGDISTAISRSILSLPGHFIYGVFMGYFIGKYRIAQEQSGGRKGTPNLWLALLIPTLLHGIYDFLFLGVQTVVWLIFPAYLFFISMVVVTVILMVKEYKAQKAALTTSMQ